MCVLFVNIFQNFSYHTGEKEGKKIQIFILGGVKLFSFENFVNFKSFSQVKKSGI